MEIFQVLIGSMFSMLGATTILYIAYRAYTIGAEVTEMKELLKDIRRASQAPIAADKVIPAVLPTTTELGNWPSVVDPDYNTEKPYELKPSGSQR
jgi:hypothetical protein